MSKTKNEVQVFQVETNAKFNENDLVTVAVAKGETMMRERILKIKESISKLEAVHEKLIAKHEKTFDNISSPIHKVYPEILKALKKVNKKAELNISTCLRSNSKKQNMNVTTLSFIGSSTARLATVETPETKEQKDLSKKIDAAYHGLSDLKTEALDIKRKLSDIPALERQMRAKVVENQIGKTAGGREFLDTLINGSDISSTLKLLGI